MQSNEYAQMLEDLVEFINNEPIGAFERERLQLYIAMKLEDASDGEIVKCLQIPPSGLRLIESQLRALAMKVLRI